MPSPSPALVPLQQPTTVDVDCITRHGGTERTKQACDRVAKLFLKMGPRKGCVCSAHVAGWTLRWMGTGCIAGRSGGGAKGGEKHCVPGRSFSVTMHPAEAGSREMSWRHWPSLTMENSRGISVMRLRQEDSAVRGFCASHWHIIPVPQRQGRRPYNSSGHLCPATPWQYPRRDDVVSRPVLFPGMLPARNKNDLL